MHLTYTKRIIVIRLKELYTFILTNFKFTWKCMDYKNTWL